MTGSDSAVTSPTAQRALFGERVICGSSAPQMICFPISDRWFIFGSLIHQVLIKAQNTNTARSAKRRAKIRSLYDGNAGIITPRRVICYVVYCVRRSVQNYFVYLQCVWEESAHVRGESGELVPHRTIRRGGKSNKHLVYRPVYLTLCFWIHRNLFIFQTPPPTSCETLILG